MPYDSNRKLYFEFDHEQEYMSDAIGVPPKTRAGMLFYLNKMAEDHPCPSEMFEKVHKMPDTTDEALYLGYLMALHMAMNVQQQEEEEEPEKLE